MRNDQVEFEAILDILGNPVSSQKLLSTLSDIGIDISTELTLPEGEYRAYIERPKVGFSLVFTDEAVFLAEEHQSDLGKGLLYFSGVFLYADGKDGYSQFSGELPNKLSFSAERLELHKCLGIPSWDRKRADGTIVAERWDDVAVYRIHITYSKIDSTPVLISLNKPDKKQFDNGNE